MSRLISRMAVMPSTLGISRSSSITSGKSSVAVMIACSPSPLSPTIVISAWLSSIERSPCLTTAWSSTMTTLIMCNLLWDIGLDVGSLAWRATQREGTMEFLDALLHQAQSEPMLQLALMRVEACAIVSDAQEHRKLLRDEREHNFCSMGMANRIGERLLGDTQKGMLYLETEGHRSDRCRDGQPQSCLIGFGHLFQGL